MTTQPMAQRLQEPEPLDMATVIKENWDFSDRLFQEGVEFAYDEDGDTLFATVGAKPRHAITEEVMGNVHVRLDPVTLKIVGAVILEFMTDFLANNRLARKLLAGFVEELREEGTIRLEGEDAKQVAPIFDAALKIG